jgi:hypothetical protein
MWRSCRNAEWKTLCSNLFASASICVAKLIQYSRRLLMLRNFALYVVIISDFIIFCLQLG